VTHPADDSRKPNPSPQPRPYHAPRLFTYGAVRELTSAGAGSVVEVVGDTSKIIRA